ncbi:MAG: hypothetical protein QOF24_1287 [Verrucomicrobiota bacterium]|jgi:hypothetical protein
MVCLAAAVLLATLLVPSASAQFIYVANAGEDTVSKIDINPPYPEVARYATWFTTGAHNMPHPGDPWHGPAPSRIAQDSAGNVFVLNRFFDTPWLMGTSPPNPSHLPVLLKIAPSGSGPTSSGSAVLSMLDNNTMNNEIDIPNNEAADKRIVWAQPVGNPGDEGKLGRALAIDPSGFLWVGLFSAQKYYKVNPNTGITTGGAIPMPSGSNHRPYGAQVDTRGVLWSVDENDTADNELAEIDTATGNVTIHKIGSAHVMYSLSIFNGCGGAPEKIYLSDRSLSSATTYRVYDPQTSTFSVPPLPASAKFRSVAVAVDSQGNIVSGEYLNTGRVIKTSPSGGVLWDTGPRPVAQQIPDLHGIIVDANDDVWAVDRVNGRVIKYKGTTSGGTSGGTYITTVKVGDQPYTYGNPPPPTCPCAVTSEPQIKCDGKDKDGKWKYSWSFVVTNHSPFSMPATAIDISVPTTSPVKNLAPGQFTFTPSLSPGGHATVTGTFTLDQPMPGSQICLDIRLNFGEVGWCCPTEHVCFVLPDCACASLQGTFRCNHGQRFLDLSVTNLGPTAAAGAQIFSNTPGVTVSPQTTTLGFPQNTPVIIPPLTVTGATPGQVISLSVMLHGPTDDRTGVNSWCCTATVQVTYPSFPCLWWPNGELFDDINANGIRDSGDGGLPEWTVTLTPEGKGTPRTTKSDASGAYHFEEIEPGKYRLSVQPPQGWRATAPKDAVHSLTVEAPPKERLDFGFVKTR